MQRRTNLVTSVLIGDYTVQFNAPNLINTREARIEAVSGSNLRAAAKKYLTRNSETVIITKPANQLEKAADHN